MRLDRVTLALLALVPALAHCEPVYEEPPPATPPPPPASPPPPSPPSASTGGEAAAGGPNADSEEYTLGEDTDSYDDADPAALKDFHAALDPHGTWVDDPKYGTIWVPSAAAVGADFTPYATAGHWAYDSDWVWMSDYPWGWAPFHYGRWLLVEGRGWGWVPGRAYRGAWVTWGVNDGYTYLGWAPMPPAFFWFGGLAVGWGGYIAPSWVYCPRGEVFSPAVGGHVVAGAKATPIAAGMRAYIPATPGVAGPSPQKLGLAASQVPHPTGAPAPSVSQAQAFARPSTGQALGASNPTRTATPAAVTAASHPAPAVASQRPSITTVSPHPTGTGATVRATAPNVAHGPVGAQSAGAGAHTALPAARSSGGWHGGGGGWHSGGGGHHR